MAVVIHELEVLPQQQQAAAGGAAGQATPPGDGKPASVAVLDVQRAVRQLRERSLRVWAH